MKNFVLVPDGLVVASALVLLLLGRARRRTRWWMPVAAGDVTLVALAVELWAGAAVSTYVGGALVQDRFALFAKAAVLLAATLAIAVTDWSDEDAPAIGMSMVLLAAFGAMVVASAGDFVGLWAGLGLAAGAGVRVGSAGRPEPRTRVAVV